MINVNTVSVQVRQTQKELTCDSCKSVGRSETDERVQSETFALMTEKSPPEGWTVLRYQTPFGHSFFNRRVDLCEACSLKALAAVQVKR